MRYLLLILGLVLTLPAAAAPPKAPDNRQKAQELMREGNQLYLDRDYEAALDRFRRAQALFPSYKLEYNIANTLFDQGKLVESAALLERFLEEREKEAHPAVLEVARARFNQARARVCGLVVNLAEEGVAVTVDGTPRGETPLAGTIYLAPGTHRLRLTKAGFEAYKNAYVLGAGEYRRVWARLEPLATTEEPAEAAGAAGAARSAAGQEEPVRRAPRRRIWGYVSLGLGVALAGGAAALYGVGIPRGGDAHEQYRALTDRPLDAAGEAELAGVRDDLASARGMVIGAGVLSGAALLALGASVYLLVSGEAEGASSGTTQGHAALPRLGFWTASGGGGLTVGGSF